MDHLPLTSPTARVAAASLPPSQGAGRVLDAYKTALATAASAAAYAVMARSMVRELLPDELRAAARWSAAAARAWFGRGEKERHTIVIRHQFDAGYSDNHLFDAARAYLATRIDPRAMRRLCLARSRANEPDGSSRWNTLFCMEPGGCTVDVFCGVEFTWTCVETGDDDRKKGKGGGGGPREFLELSFDAEHTETALERYVPFVTTGKQRSSDGRLISDGWSSGRRKYVLPPTA